MPPEVRPGCLIVQLRRSCRWFPRDITKKAELARIAGEEPTESMDGKIITLCSTPEAIQVRCAHFQEINRLVPNSEFVSNHLRDETSIRRPRVQRRRTAHRPL